MKERPILMKAPMVRALLAGRKTQTRRLVKPQPKLVHAIHADASIITERIFRDGDQRIHCPLGQPGDRLWVRETWRVTEKHNRVKPKDLPHERGMTVFFEAGGSRAHDDSGKYVNDNAYPIIRPDWVGKRRTSIHIPRWASRIDLEIINVRVERLQAISEADCAAEGIEVSIEPGTTCAEFGMGLRLYRQLWESIYGPGSWAFNPWVWVIEFEVVSLREVGTQRSDVNFFATN